MYQGLEHRALEAFVVDENDIVVAEMLNFTWEVVDFRETEMTMIV